MGPASLSMARERNVAHCAKIKIRIFFIFQISFLIKDKTIKKICATGTPVLKTTTTTTTATTATTTTTTNRRQ
jgi:hypothetical protein